MTKQTTMPARLLTAILVHADAAIRTAVAAVLKDGAGWRVLGVSNGGEAVQAALAILPQVVLLDPYLQGMDGVATIAALRAHGIGCPVVALVEHNEQAQHWEDRGFAGAIVLSAGLPQVLPRLHMLLTTSSSGQDN